MGDPSASSLLRDDTLRIRRNSRVCKINYDIRLSPLRREQAYRQKDELTRQRSRVPPEKITSMPATAGARNEEFHRVGNNRLRSAYRFARSQIRRETFRLGS